MLVFFKSLFTHQNMIIKLEGEIYGELLDIGEYITMGLIATFY